jgi:hypothetical protein
MSPSLATRVAAAAASAAVALAINNGKGVTPPQGWRSWNLVSRPLIATPPHMRKHRKRLPQPPPLR